MTPTVCLDAGHGGHDSGAVGPTGLREKDVALDVVLMIGEILKGTCKVIYTRRTDVFIELHERAAMANRGAADIFVSIHCNSGPPGQGAGFETWTAPGQTASDWLATDVFNQYGEEFPALGRRMDLADGDVDKEASFAVLRLTRMAAVLHELEFIHTERGEAWLRDEGNQERAAKAIARAILKYLKLGTQAVTPPVDAEEVSEPAAIQPLPGQRKLLEIEGLAAALDRWNGKVGAATAEFRTELEAIFKKS
jgi:N-acetylmuramoyl-L-alanine amidase